MLMHVHTHTGNCMEKRGRKKLRTKDMKNCSEAVSSGLHSVIVITNSQQLWVPAQPTLLKTE